MNITLIDNNNSYNIVFNLINNNIVEINTLERTVMINKKNIIDNFTIEQSKITINNTNTLPIPIIQ